MAKQYAVIRRDCLMEDEGRQEFIRSYSSKEEAQDWIKAQKDEYFKPQDYYISVSTGD